MTTTMLRKAAQRLGLLLGLAASITTLPGSASHAAPPDPPPDPPPGQLLVASAKIQDPRFRHAVVLLLRHDRTGAFGIVINHPLGERPLAAVLNDAEGRHAENERRKDQSPNGDAAITGSIQIMLGGPVQPQLGFVVHSADYRRPGTLAVTGQLAMTASKQVLRDIGHHQGPVKYLFALGYSGWGAGQLEGEIARSDWFTVPAEPDLVFDADRKTVWEKALARRTREL